MPDEKQKDEATQALDAARQLARMGDYEAALQKHIWFHHKALLVNRSLYGVRLSFALADWVELGEKYPKALFELKVIRDRKTANLLSGIFNKEIFSDVVAINRVLKEVSSTVELFKRLAEINGQFAIAVYESASDALLTHQEYEIAKKHMGDPQDFLERIIKVYFRGLQFLNISQEVLSEEERKVFERIFTKKVIGIITVLNNSGEKKTAVDIQSKALKILDNADIRNAIDF
jgi:hypothetical protein